MKNKKTIKNGVFYNMIYQALLMVVPLITSPYLSRVLGPDKIGEYQFRYSFAYYFFLFAMLGVNIYGNREAAKFRDNKEKRSSTFWQIFYMQFFSSIILTVAYIITGFFIKSIDALYLVQIIQILSVIFDINWYAFALEEFKLTTIRSIIVKIITTILIFIFVKGQSDIIKYSIIVLGGNFIGLGMIVPLIFKTTNFEKPKFSEIKKHLKPNLILFVPTLASSVYTYMDKIMLGFLTTNNEVGFYNYAENIISIPCSLTTAVSTVMLPRISNMIIKGEKEKSKKYLNKSLILVTGINIALMFGIIAVADIFVPWYLGNEYIYSAYIVKILGIYIILNGITLILRSQWLIPLDKDKEYTKSIIIGAIVNFIMNLILIRCYKAVGATIATIVSSFIIMIMQMYYSKDGVNIKNFLLVIIPFMILGMCMYGAIISFNNFFNNCNVILKIVLDVIIGCLIFLPITSIYMLKINKKLK